MFGSNVLLPKMYRSPAIPAATAIMMIITISWSLPSRFAIRRHFAPIIAESILFLSFTIQPFPPFLVFVGFGTRFLSSTHIAYIKYLEPENRDYRKNIKKSQRIFRSLRFLVSGALKLPILFSFLWYHSKPPDPRPNSSGVADNIYFI